MIKEIIMIILTFCFISFAMGLLPNESMDDECSMSEYNKYSNTTGATYFMGRCYIPVYGTYESTERCGTFGISCYETEPYQKGYKGNEICFNLKTGERC